jgi:hypothetical protein
MGKLSTQHKGPKTEGRRRILWSGWKKKNPRLFLHPQAAENTSEPIPKKAKGNLLFAILMRV